MSGFLWRMAGAFALLIVGLAMMFYSLERLSLINLAETLGQGDGERPFGLTASLFIGLIGVNFALFYALTRWAAFIRRNPGTPQAPVSLLITVLCASGLAFVASIAIHASYLRTLEVVPMDVSWGYICFQVLAAAVALIVLVLIAVRWSPGYRRGLTES